MKGIRIFLSRRPGDYLTFNNVQYYAFRSGFLCMTLSSGKYICYNLNRIERFEID